jgi:hypothetical protein
MTRTGGSRADQYHPLRPASYLRAGCRDGDLVNQGGTQQLWQVNIKDNVGRLIVHGELRPRLRQPAVVDPEGQHGASISGLATPPAAHARSARRCSTRCSPAMAYESSRRRSVASGESLCEAVCGDATARIPRPHADLRRTPPLADPGRVRGTATSIAPPVAGTTTAAAEPADRYDHPD